MNYIGETVKHKEYGLGTVVEQSGRLITVVFPMHGKKVFKKSILERHVMRIVDKESEEIKELNCMEGSGRWSLKRCFMTGSI